MQPSSIGAARVSHWLAAVLACLLMPAAWLSALPSAAAHDRPGPCDLHRQADESIRQHSKELIRCSANRWEVPDGARKAICIADRESGLNPAAMSRNRVYRGLFQHHKAYWRERYEEYSLRNWSLNRHALNGRTAAIVSIRMASDVGWGAWRGKGC